MYREARRFGFHTNAYAGGAAGAGSIRGAIERLRAERIGHETRAHEDIMLVEYLAETQTPVEMCPVSNVRTGVVDELLNHPIREYFKRGIAVTVNTDDPKMFGTSLAQEYGSLVEDCDFTRRDICNLILTAIESSWLPDDRKHSLQQSCLKDPSWLDE